jgi:hypothetical protein
VHASTPTDKKNQYFFDIMGPSKVYNIKVNTAEEKAHWLKELRGAMEGAKNIQQHPINKVCLSSLRSPHGARSSSSSIASLSF